MYKIKNRLDGGMNEWKFFYMGWEIVDAVVEWITLVD